MGERRGGPTNEAAAGRRACGVTSRANQTAKRPQLGGESRPARPAREINKMQLGAVAVEPGQSAQLCGPGRW